MPLVKTVSVHYGRKINLGDYNSANVECTVWADVDPDEDLDAAMHALWSCTKENVKAQLVPLAKKNGAGSINIKETFLGLPIEARDEDLPGEGADTDPRTVPSLGTSKG